MTDFITHTHLPRLAILITLLAAPFGWASERNASSPDGKVSASVVIHPEPARLNENLEMNVTVTHPADTQLEPFPLKGGDLYGSFRVAGLSSDPPVITEGIETSVFRAELTPTESGDARLLPIPLSYRRGGTEEKSTLIIPADSIQVQSEFDQKNEALSEIPYAEPIGTFPRGPVVIGLILAVIAAGIVLLLRRRWDHDPSEPILSPQERALKSLRELKESHIAETDLRSYYIQLTGIIRRFIEETTGIRAPEQTTEEFLRSIETDSASLFSQNLKGDLAAFLEFADLVKFAKYIPSPEEIDEGFHKGEKVILHEDLAKPVEKEESKC